MSSPSRFILRQHDQITASLLLGIVALCCWNIGGETPERPIWQIPSQIQHQTPQATEYRFQINVNQASAEELMELPGIGEKLAEAILQHRAAVGPFPTLESVMDVKGIGPKKWEAMKPHIRLHDERPDP